MKIQWKSLILFIALPILVGAVAGLITGGGMRGFEMVEKPPLSPPAWLFPVVWTVLYALMGIASYIVFTADGNEAEARRALGFYALQLAFNFVWPILYFGFGLYWVAFGWLIALLVLVIVTTVMFFRIKDTAGYLMLPYVAWLLFAAYLNLGVAILN